MSKISELLVFCATDTTNATMEVDIGVIPNYQGQKINEATGIKVNLSRKIVSNHGIKHVIKRHGLSTKEKERGQKELCDVDFECIPSILSDPDSIEKGADNGKGEKTIKFHKAINGIKYCIIMAIRERKKGLLPDLVFNTMFAKI